MINRTSELSNDVLSVIASVLPSYEVYPFLNRKLKKLIPRLEEITKEDSKYYWSIQSAHSKHPLRYKKRHATVYLVSFGKIKESIYKCWESQEESSEGDELFDEEIGGLSYNNFYSSDVTIRMLDKVYPTLSNRLDRGDIIEFIEESGYRSKGIMFFDGEKLIAPCTKYNIHGTPPIEFEIITEFPVDYFKKPLRGGHNLTVVKDYVGSRYNTEFYWTSGIYIMALYMHKLGIVENIKMALENKIGRNRYVYITYRKLKILLVLDYDLRRLPDEYILVRPIEKENHRFDDNIDIVLTTEW